MKWVGIALVVAASIVLSACNSSPIESLDRGAGYTYSGTTTILVGNLSGSFEDLHWIPLGPGKTLPRVVENGVEVSLAGCGQGALGRLLPMRFNRYSSSVGPYRVFVADVVVGDKDVAEYINSGSSGSRSFYSGLLPDASSWTQVSFSFADESFAEFTLRQPLRIPIVATDQLGGSYDVIRPKNLVLFWDRADLHSHVSRIPIEDP